MQSRHLCSKQRALLRINHDLAHSPGDKNWGEDKALIQNAGLVFSLCILRLSLPQESEAA